MAKRQVSVFVDGKQVENTMRAILQAKKQINKELNLMTVGSEEYNQQVAKLRELNKHISDHRKSLYNTQSAYGKLTAGIGNYLKMAAGAFAVGEVVAAGRELFRLGAEMELLGKKAETVFGKALPAVTAEAEKNATAMGLTASEYTDAATAIGDLLVPMQFTREEAANMSTGLVNLSGALSEWTGGQVTAAEVTDILGKAMLGEREQLKSLGIAISEADVSARLAEKGLQNLTGEYLQQAKAIATVELITEKSTDAQAAYLENSDTLVRRQAEMTAKFSQIKEQLATALIPIFVRLLEVAEPVVETFVDTVDALSKGEEQVSTFGKAVQVLVDVFGFLWDRLKVVGNIFNTVISLISGDFPLAIQYAKLSLQQWANNTMGIFNKIADFAGIDFRLELFDTQPALDKIAELEGRIDATVEKSKQLNQAAAGGATRPPTRPASDDAAAKERAKAQAKELDELRKHQENLAQVIAAYAEEARLSALSEDARKLEELRLSYQKEIDLAKELEAKKVQGATEQRLELERLQAEAIDALQAEIAAKNIERINAQFEEEQRVIAENLQARIEAEKTIKEATDEVLLSEQELAIQELENYYMRLRFLAEEHGINMSAIDEAYRKQKAELDAKFLEETEKKQTEAFIKQAKAMEAAYGAAATIIGSLYDALISAGAEASAFGRLLALAEIGFNSAKAVSAAIAAGAGVPFPGNLPAIASGVAAVVGGIAQATAILNETPRVEQRFTGGFFGVQGAQDGRNYNAQYLGYQPTGMLPNRPVILASERGAEYLVSAPDLRNPQVLDHVRAIENISKNRTVPQYADGGFTNEGSSQAAEVASLAAVVNRLTQAVVALEERGIPAYIDDITLLDARTRTQELLDAGGGVG